MEPSEEVRDLGALLDAGDNAVVTLVAGDTSLVVHRAVVAARSPVFSAKFRHDTLETSNGQIVIPDMQGPVLRLLMTYIYTLQVPHVTDMAPQLLAASDIYGVSVLKAECERQVAKQLSVETAAATAVLAIRHSCDRLRQVAVNFIRTHTHEVMATQGWADAVNNQPEDVVEVSRLLSEPEAETSMSHVSESMESDGVVETTAMDLGALLDAGDGAVVTVVAGDTRLVAHRAVLSNRSPVLAAKFRQDMLDSNSGQLTVPDVEGPVLRQLLVYFYLLQVPQLPDMAAQLLAAADIYGVSILKAECERQVEKQLSIETAAAIAILAVRHSCTNLKSASINFIKDHTHEVMATEGWADAVRTQPEDVVEVSLLLSETATETSEPASAAPPTADDAAVSQTCEPASAAPPTADDAAVSQTCEPATADSGSTQPQCDPGQSSGSDVPPTPSDAVSHVRNLAGKRGRSLIDVAKDGPVQELKALLAAGADVGVKDWTNWTALHHAACLGHVEAVGALLTAGADVNTRDIYQETPLHCTAKNGHAAVVRMLVASSADLNTRDVHGRTPLHLAAYYGHIETVEALLEAGADKTAVDEDGRTPLDIAKQYDKQQLIDMLK